MLASLLRLQRDSTDNYSSKLYDNVTFYHMFEEDIQHSQSEIIIESPFITMRRLKSLMSSLRIARSRGVNIVVNTKSIEEHETYFRSEAERGIDMLQKMGVKVLFTGGHHRKLAIIDRQILWEGSLNILSQNDSCEIMRRIKSDRQAEQMIRFIGLKRFL